MKWGKIIILSLLGLIFSACISFGPQKFEMKLSRTYGEEKNDLAYSFQSIPEGYILAGTSNSFSGTYDTLLIKTDKDGNEIWKKIFRAPGKNIAVSVHVAPDGGYVVFGRTEEPSDENLKKVSNINYTNWIIKADENGEKLWEKTLEIEEDFVVNSVQQTSEGYIIWGVVRYLCEHGMMSDMMILKVDKEGNVLYKKKFNTDGHKMWNSIKETSDGYIIAGYTFHEDSSLDALLIKTDKDGEIEWSKTYSYSDKDWLQDIQIISDGYILLGYTSKKDDKYLPLGGDYMLIKTDKNGEEIWMKTYGHNTSELPDNISNLSYMEDTPFSLLEIHDGYIIAGAAFIHEEEYNFDIFLVKTDKDGKEICDQLYGTEGSSFGGPMIKTGKNEFVLLANTWVPENSDIWLMKIAVK